MPKTKLQNNEIIEKRKECILNAALYLFAVHGYRAISCDDVAKLVGCSRPLVYHYYTDKENLWKAVFEKNVTKIIDLTRSVNYEKPADEALTELINKILETIKSSSPENPMSCVIYLLLNLFLEKDFVPPPPGKPEDRPLSDRPLFLITYYLIEKGQKEGSVRNENPKEMTIALMSLIKSLAYNKIYLQDKFTCPSINILMNMILLKGVK